MMGMLAAASQHTRLVLNMSYSRCRVLLRLMDVPMPFAAQHRAEARACHWLTHPASCESI